jgi:TolB-like protein/tetratricopeptide (TPR) repeat protein
MAGISDKLSKFWLELKRRKTNRVIILYAAAAFSILQLVDILAPALSLPEWTITFIIIVLAIGFPVSLVFSWIFDITPGGIEKTKPVSEKKRHKMKNQLKAWQGTTMVSWLVIVALISYNFTKNKIESNEIRQTEKSIAVLPFESLTPDEIQPYTCDVISSIITTDLKKIQEIRVIPRMLVLEYNSKNRKFSEIVRKLKVSFIVTGELVNAKDHIIVNVSLIRSRKGKPIFVWADKYSFRSDEDITELDEIPLDIVKNLKLSVSPSEKNSIKQKPTYNTAAFLNFVGGATYQDDAYNVSVLLSKGDSIFRNLSVEESFNKALLFYDKAIEADSTFALAYAKRAITRSWGYRAGHFTREDQMGKCLHDIQCASSIDKDLPEVYFAYGFYYYYFVKDYDKALEYFRIVTAKDPGNWQCKFFAALVLRAQGEWEESQALMKQVVKDNIQDPLYLTNIGLSYQILHQYDTAIYYHEQAIQLLPEWSGPYQNKIESLILRDGNTVQAEIVLDTALNKAKGGQLRRNKIVFDLYNRKFEDALIEAEISRPEDFKNQGDRYLLLAEIYDNLENQSMAGEYYKSAFEFFCNALSGKKDDPEMMSLAGISAAGLKDNVLAVNFGLKALEQTKYDGPDKSERLVDLARIYTMTGENKKSIEVLEEVLKNPSNISDKLLRIDPIWKSLNKYPDFRRIIE